MANSTEDFKTGPVVGTSGADSMVDDGNRSTAAPSGNETEKDDPNIVDWDGPDDPANPRNWSSFKRNSHVVMVSLFTLNA